MTSPPKFLLWTGWGLLLISPLLPVVAAIAHHRSTRYIHHSWMNRLAMTLGFNLVVNWILLGLAFQRVHNAWLANLTFPFDFFFSLWVLSGIGPTRLPAYALVPTFSVISGLAIWESSRLGFGNKWLASMTASTLILLGFCLWRLLEQIRRPARTSFFDQPAFWVLGAWVMWFGIAIIFNPLFTFFMKHLGPTWILVPWLVKYFLGLVLNLAVSWTFLCRNPSSP